MQSFRRCTRRYLQLDTIFLTKRRTISSKMERLKFDNKVLRTLPIDEEKSNFTRTVNGACFSLVDTTPVENPKLVGCSPSALELLGLSEEDTKEDSFNEYFSGSKLIPGSQTAAHCYCGHQFGYFSGQLGDGAAIYLGEIINTQNERWELQLKGAGQTPYSRQADGRKVLRSSIREFLCSEAMFHLGVPTTRAGTCVTSDSRVVRDIFYDGHPTMERCTVVSRIAPTFIRFGSFEIFKPQDRYTGRTGPSVGRKDVLHKMLEYVIESFYNDIWVAFHSDKEKCYLEFYKEVVRRTAKLVAHWQCVGFCHGVLNTDNMSILGLTIDYGPYGFMDYFDADFICNASDNNGRYSYKKQPEICKWNLLKLAEAIKDALPLEQSKKCLDELYDVEFQRHYYGMMRNKLGISEIHGKGDEDLIQKLLHTMQESSADFTNTFRLLSEVPCDEASLQKPVSTDVIQQFVNECQNIDGIKKKLKTNVHVEQITMLLKIAESNPFLLRQLDMSEEQLKSMLVKAEKEKELTNLSQAEISARNKELWTDWLNSYRDRLKAEFETITETDERTRRINQRKENMDAINPKYILRNYMAQEAIEAAEAGDYTKVQDLLHLLEKPYIESVADVVEKDDQPSQTVVDPARFCKYACSAPQWASDLRVT